MNLIRRLSFGLWYLRRPPWDSGIVPPEVEDYIQTHPPGRALDLGCGSGTSSLALAQAGWRVTGVEFIPRAIKIAQQRAKASDLTVDFFVADVTRLPHSLFSSPYDLVLDIGCFHGLLEEQKKKYLDDLETLIAPGGMWLMYGFLKETRLPGSSKPRRSGSSGLLVEDIKRAQARLTLVKQQDGVDKRSRPSAWFWFTE